MRALIAGIGNVLLGDDAFGVEVARRLAVSPLANGTTVEDFGIRGLHLALEISGGDYDVVVLVDACRVDGPPGSLALLEVELTDVASADVPISAHDLDPASVLRLVQRLGGTHARTFVVGCAPGALGEGIGLTPPVAAAIEPAMAMVQRLLEREHASCV